MSSCACKCGEAWNLLLVHSNKGNAVARAEKAALRTPSCPAHFAASRCGNIAHSVLMLAIEAGHHMRNVRLLLQNGADFEATDKTGKSVEEYITEYVPQHEAKYRSILDELRWARKSHWIELVTAFSQAPPKEDIRRHRLRRKLEHT
jgi:hypothetical protein